MNSYFVKLIKRFFTKESKYGWFGDFQNWESALAQTTGYNKDLILEKVKNSLVKVKNGNAKYERDGVIFDRIQYSWGVLSGLYLLSSLNNLKINVLDFGGSLGSSYFQNRNALGAKIKITWNIIEQEHFVKCGRTHFQNSELNFFENIQEYKVNYEYTDVLLLSSVIQYVSNPYQILTKLIELNPKAILIDITTFNYNSRDIITIQKVPPEIYDASYPCWFFNKSDFDLFFISRGYSIFGEWRSPDKINFGFHGGMILVQDTLNL